MGSGRILIEDGADWAEIETPAVLPQELSVRLLYLCLLTEYEVCIRRLDYKC